MNVATRPKINRYHLLKILKRVPWTAENNGIIKWVSNCLEEGVIGHRHNIPVVDFSAVKEPDVLGPLHETGFFYLKIEESMDELYRLEKMSRLFFSQNVETKMKIKMENSGLAWRGYFPVGRELTSNQPDMKEGIYFGSNDAQVVHPLQGQNQYPDIAGFAECIEAWMAGMQRNAEKILQILTTQLGLSDHYFANRFQPEPTRLLRIFNYPHLNDNSALFSVGEHTDMGFLTLLWQDDSGGLEVKAIDGKWISVPPRRGYLVVNIGDMLDFWTHGILRATPHRVLNHSGGDRVSIPYFFDPKWTERLVPIAREKLPSQLLSTVTRASRWDGIKLNQINSEMTYGDYIWHKVKKVFPNLSAD